MIIVNPTTGAEVRNTEFNPFVNEVIQYLYDHHKEELSKVIKKSRTNCSIDYGTGHMTSVFYHNPAGTHVPWPRPYSFEGIPGEFYLCRDWNFLPRTGDNRDYDHLREMIAAKFPMYEVVRDPDGFKLVSSAGTAASSSGTPHAGSVAWAASGDSMIRVDYSYLSPSSVLNAAPAYCFNLAAWLLASAGNVSLLSLMDRIPVYVVDSRFMAEHFDDYDNRFDEPLFQCLRRLAAVLDLMVELLRQLDCDAPAEDVFETFERIHKILCDIAQIIEDNHLLERAPDLEIVERIRSSVEGIMNKGPYIIPGNPNIRGIVEHYVGLLRELPGYSLPPVEYLGVYCPQWKKSGTQHEKAIFVCWERILGCAGIGHETDLLAKVTVHEFCHAYMDIITWTGSWNKGIYRWMEESMANVMTLLITEEYVIRHPSRLPLLEYFRDFMTRQPDAYASAVTMWENGIHDFDLWAWNKGRCMSCGPVRTWCAEMEDAYMWISPEDMRRLWNDVRRTILGTV